jgi:hypothetical protein
MSNDTHEKVYNVLLDVQKQIGVVSRETGEQTKKLDALNEKVALANGRTAKNEGEIALLKEWRKWILGGLAVATVTGMMAATYYIEKVASKTASEAISSLEAKYDLRIEE